jgi:DNA topoisomerase IB
MAAKELAETAGFESQTEAKRNVGHATAVARRLGNTKAICRKCYAPGYLDAYMGGVTVNRRRRVHRSRAPAAEPRGTGRRRHPRTSSEARKTAA